MPRLIEVEDDAAIGLDHCREALCATGFHPDDEDLLLHAALQLRRLGNNRDFLGDILVEQLAAASGDEEDLAGYGPQVIMLTGAEESNFFLRANIWPSEAEHSMRASGGASFVYGLPHDHNFHFLTLGYFGPGYWSDTYEFDYESVVGWSGEPVDLRFVGRERLEEGKIQLYRAHRDVHAQIPPDALSVSLNIMHTSGAQGWLDQYSFDLEEGRIDRILSHGASEAFLHVAVGLGGQEALDLAHRFAKGHPSERMRLHAFTALAAAAPDAAAGDAIWREAEANGSRLVAAEARMRREALEARSPPGSTHRSPPEGSPPQPLHRSARRASRGANLER